MCLEICFNFQLCFMFGLCECSQEQIQSRAMYFVRNRERDRGVISESVCNLRHKVTRRKLTQENKNLY